MNNDEFAKRLLELVNDVSDGKTTVFARKAGISPGTFAAYVKGRLPDGERLIRICETYSVNLNWLLTGAGDKYIDIGNPGDEPPPIGGKALPDGQFLDIHRTLQELAGLSDTALRDVEMFLAGMVKGLRNRAGAQAGDSGRQAWDGIERRSGRDRRSAQGGD